VARRKRTHLLRELATLPWWVSPVVASIVYVALRWVFPAIAGTGVLLKGLAETFSGNAALFAAPFLVVAMIAAFNAFRRRKLLDDQVGLGSLKTPATLRTLSCLLAKPSVVWAMSSKSLGAPPPMAAST
jgi:ABC-type sulfate transport system permease subunit